MNEVGSSVRYTNHCIRATVATGLKRTGVDDLSIMSVTGHRNVKSLESYIAGSTEQQRRELSHTLHRVASADKSALVSKSSCGQNLEHEPTVTRTQQIAVVSATLERNPLKDLNMFSQATISGGTININVINKQ